MPYTVKATTSWADETLPSEDRVAKVKTLYTSEFRTDAYNPAPVLELRRQAVKDGNLLARGAIISTDGLSVTVTNVWKSQAAFESYRATPAVVEYMAGMRGNGWKVDIVIV